MATYNGGCYLAEQLESISEQTYKNWHLVVADDGSRDDTLDVIDGFSQLHPGKVTIASHDKLSLGACGNFFFLMKSTAGLFPYYAFCDQDDYWEPDKLKLSLDAMRDIELDGLPALVFSDAQVVDASLRPISSSFFSYTGVDPRKTTLANLLVQNPVSGAGTLVNSALVELASRPDNLEGIAMHDQWIGLVASAFGRVRCVENATYKYRQHEYNESGAIRMSFSSLPEKARIARASLNKKQAQAYKFLLTYKDLLDEHSRMLSEGFSGLSNLSKVQRLGFCVRNGLFMNGLMRNVGLFFFV